ncbi:MAG: PEP-CTERM sorting domain-containing protein [Desulfopila sp.]
MQKRVVVGYVAVLTLALGGAARANPINVSESYSPVLQVDGSSGRATIEISQTGVIDDLNIWIDFTKCDNPIAADGTCVGADRSYNREIEFRLVAPDLRTYANLIEENSITGQNTGARVSYTFDDEASSSYPADSLISGRYIPFDSLSVFDGLEVAGIWTLFFQDTWGADPLSLNRWGLDITTAGTKNDPVPEPATMLLLGSGLAGLAGSRLRRKKRGND